MSNIPQSSNRRKARSKNGCLTCRVRKVKCDERRPACQRCTNGLMKCEWLEPGQSLSSKGARSSKSSTPSSISQRPLAPSPTAGTDGSHGDDPEECNSAEAEIHLTLPHNAHINVQELSSPRPALSTSHIPLSNSLQLSADDQAAFLYIPESILVLSYGKLWTWSCFSYIYTHIASQYSGVMRSFIAVASMELRAREVLAVRDGNDPARSMENAHRIGAAAGVHYSATLKDLSSLLNHICHSEGSSNDIDALFTMWFLILRYEVYDSESKGASLVHLDGIRSFLKPYLETGGYANGEKLPYISQPMLLYTLYLDADSATGNINGGRLCMDLLSRDADDHISHERIFLSARSILPKIWGETYPVSELLDDLENYRPLRLFHLCQAAKLELMRLARSAIPDLDAAEVHKLWKHTQNFGDEFADILILAKSIPDSGGKRLIWTVYSAALDYHALQVLFACLFPRDESRFQLDAALSQILAIASKALGEDPRQIYRFMWSLSVALCKTQGHNNQHWLTAQLDRARVLMPNFDVPDLILQHKLKPNEGPQLA
ncbi:hypothetical protein BGZ61DRAFT_423526 [Ilyonectria robusta]|uniref:uncharacterized protein n=1 Tax=Ilyonectria robusta TaxID=1079257 RepID=UPI001E8ED773|nr:uncharacterized protein BGZ61DRAFT_423526 [Ilyonectria robusta]KAH8685085.1 hypothetical protein BGZ61DRAFT_423526 [Ilyonectria robusta]